MAAGLSDADDAHQPAPVADAPAISDESAIKPDTSPAQEAVAAAATTSTDSEDSALSTSDPPLPEEEAPPLPDEPPPDASDDGWTAKWDSNAQAWYFYNNRTGLSQWDNPRVPAAATTYSYGQYDRVPNEGAASYPTTSGAPGTSSPPRRKWGGYNPAIHGSYDPNADYAQEASREEEEEEHGAVSTTAGLPKPNAEGYVAQAHFNRFTGKFQQADAGPELHNDENKSKRQMGAFFDVDAAANSHDGRSLKAERRGKTLSKKELKAFKEKRHNKKEEKRRAWLRD